jgi:hypothetical protein
MEAVLHHRNIVVKAAHSVGKTRAPRVADAVVDRRSPDRPGSRRHHLRQRRLTSRGQIAVETKEEMRKRNLPSPDRADALAYAFAQVDMVGVDVQSHKGESITEDLMTKAW